MRGCNGKLNTGYEMRWDMKTDDSTIVAPCFLEAFGRVQMGEVASLVLTEAEILKIG